MASDQSGILIWGSYMFRKRLLKKIWGSFVLVCYNLALVGKL